MTCTGGKLTTKRVRPVYGHSLFTRFFSPRQSFSRNPMVVWRAEENRRETIGECSAWSKYGPRSHDICHGCIQHIITYHNAHHISQRCENNVTTTIYPEANSMGTVTVNSAAAAQYSQMQFQNTTRAKMPLFHLFLMTSIP